MRTLYNKSILCKYALYILVNFILKTDVSIDVKKRIIYHNFSIDVETGQGR